MAAAVTCFSLNRYCLRENQSGGNLKAALPTANLHPIMAGQAVEKAQHPPCQQKQRGGRRRNWDAHRQTLGRFFQGAGKLPFQLLAYQAASPGEQRAQQQHPAQRVGAQQGKQRHMPRTRTVALHGRRRGGKRNRLFQRACLTLRKQQRKVRRFRPSPPGF